MCFLALFLELEEVEKGAGLLELQCTFIWGDNRKKKFWSPVEALILFNEGHQGLFKLQFPLGWEWVWSSERERVGLSPREGIMEQVLVSGLLWLGGNSW